MKQSDKQVAVILDDDEIDVAVILADDEIDSVMENQKSYVSAHVKELKALDCSVSVKYFPNWEEAEKFEEKKRGW